MAPTPLRTRHNISRTQLLTSCMMALLAGPVGAQTYADRALQGDTTIASGTVVIGRTPLKDTITVVTPQAIINWNPETGPGVLPPSPAPINFLPNGREALFQGAAGLADFVVLNRILPSTTRPISINGTVTSQVTPFAGLPPQRGGSVWFYSPGGIIAGPTSVFNVGNLILTANDIDATGGLFSGAGAIRFRGAANSTSAVTVAAGAQFNLSNAGSYLALVAPQVVMGGTATVNGSAAYVAAEQVDVTLNGGLFSIGFLTGTGVADALTHSGTTTGPSANGTIAMAAMPKNTAITMLIGGTVGYTPAATATVQNGTIVLSAGQDLIFGNIAQNVSATAANIAIGSGLYRSQVNAGATNIAVAPTGGAPATFTSNVNLAGRTSAQVVVGAGQSMTVGGILNLSARTPGAGGAAGITVNDGTLTVGGQTLIDTNAAGADNPAGAGGNATGGQSLLTINGGTVTLNDTVFMTANGNGGAGITSGGNGRGGTAAIALNAGATPTRLILNGIGHQVTATGTVGGQFPSVNGGNATGGTASLTIGNGTMTSIELALDASATGGDATTGIAGTASGGTARVQITGGRYDTRTLNLTATERQAGAGTGGTSGSTSGTGLAAVDVSGTGVLAVGATGGNSMSISADAIKGNARFGTPGAGGALIAGTARLTATNGGIITTDATAPSAPKPPVLVTASVTFSDSIPGAPSSVQRAGTAIVNADGGTMTLHKLDMRANALVRDFNLAADPAGPSFGGSVTLAARNGGTVSVLTGSGVTPLSAFATGGSIGTPAVGTGGAVNVLALGGTVALPDGFTGDARGYAGANGAGAGGTINVQAAAGTGAQPGSLTSGVTTLDASGQLDAASPNGPAGAITISNTGPGQTMRFGDLTAFAGQQFSTGTAGTINVAADGAAIDVTNNARFQTLGDLAITMSGLTARLNVGATLQAGGNNIILSHLGVAPATNLTTIAASSVDMQAGNVIQQGTDFRFVGPATIRGGTVRLTARRDLGGADGAVFATGGIELGNGRNITFRTVDTNGGLSGYNDVSSTTPYVQVSGAFNIGNAVRVGTGNLDIRAGTGIDIGNAGLSDPGFIFGQLSLSSTTGDIRLVTSGTIPGTRPNGIFVTAPGGTVRFTTLSSRAGLNINGANGIVGGNATSNFFMQLASANGAITFDRLFGSSVTATGLAITGNTVDTTVGNVVLSGLTGVDVATVTGQTAALTAAAGTVRVATNLAIDGTVTATGRSIFLRSLGTLNFNTLNATAGNLDVSSVGTLSVTTPTATGTVSLASTGGNVAFGTGTAGTGFTVAAAGAATGTSANSGTGPLAITGTTGITVPTLISGGTTTLNAANGAVNVATTLQSVGTVNATGRSIALSGLGPITAGILNATAGSLTLTTNGPLTTGASTATGNITLQSFNGGQTFGTVQAGGSAFLSAAGSIAGTSVTSGTFATVQAGGSVTLQTAQAGTNLGLYGSPATGTVTVTGTTVAGGWVETRAAALAFGNVTAGTDAILSSFNGALTVGDVTAGDDIFLTVNGSFANPNNFLTPDSQTGQTSNTQFALTAGNLRSTGLGSDVAQSGGQSFGAGAGPAGNVIRVRASGAVQTGSITTPGTAIIASDLASAATQAISAPAGVAFFVRGNASAADVTTNGDFWLGSSLQYFLATPTYQVSNFPFSQTATTGNGTFGAIRARIIRGSAAGNFGFTSLTSTSDILWTTFNPGPGGTTLPGGGITGGNITSGGSLNFTAGQAIALGAVTTTGSALIVGLDGNITATSITGSPYIEVGARNGGIIIPVLTTPGQALLGAVNGPVRVDTNVFAGGGLIVEGDSVFLRGTGTIDATRLIAGAGAIDVVAAGNLTVTESQSSGGTALTSTGGNLTGTTVTSGGATLLAAPAGTINVPILTSTGLVQANARNVIIASPGALAFQSLGATAGSVIVTTTGTLAVPDVTATEDIRFATGGAPAVMTTGVLTAGDDIVLSGNTVTTGNLTTTGLGPDTEGTGSAVDLQFNRIATGTVNSAGSILLAASQPIGFTSTNSRTSTIIRSFGTITGGASVAGTTLDIQGGNIDVGNGQAGGALNYVNFNPGETIRTGTLTGASVTASSRGTLATGAVNAPGAVSLLGDLGLTVASATSTSGDLQLIAQTSGPIASGALRAGGNITVSGQAGNDVLTTLDAGGRILIGAGGGTLTFTRATAGGLVGISAGGNIGFDAVTAGGTFQMQTPGAITGTSATSAGGAPNIVQGDAGITLPTLVTNGVTLLTATNGTVSVATDLRSSGAVTARGRSVFLRSGGALAFDEITATAGGADVATTGALTVAQATASGALALTSGGTATINGVATGATVAIASPDIVIGANGRLGTLSTTTQLTLTNNSTQNRTFIGGTGGAGYSLSAAELGRLTANNITIVAPVIGTASTAFNSSRLPDVSIDAFTFAANTGLGANGVFAIQTGGKVRVTGAVAFTGMGNGQTFAIRGDEVVEVLDAGRIALNGTGALGGTLDLTSRNIVASSSAALADFAAATDLKAIGDRAGKNDGSVDDGGYLQANTIRATLLNSTLIIQNTGAATTTANRDYSGRRGFTVGAGGFTVVQGGTNPVRVAINGRQVGMTTPLGAPTVGGFVTGLDMIPLIKIVSVDPQAGSVFQVPPSGVLTAEQLAAAPRLFDTTSTVNGCAITGGSGCRVVPNDPIRDILLGDFGEGSVGNLLPLALIQLKDYVTPGDEPLIDEPVTGAGNDDLWSVDDTKPKCDPAKEVCK
jgi:hypothetical protein